MKPSKQTLSKKPSKSKKRQRLTQQAARNIHTSTAPLVSQSQAHTPSSASAPSTIPPGVDTTPEDHHAANLLVGLSNSPHTSLAFDESFESTTTESTYQLRLSLGSESSVTFGTQKSPDKPIDVNLAFSSISDTGHDNNNDCSNDDKNKKPKNTSKKRSTSS